MFAGSNDDSLENTYMPLDEIIQAMKESSMKPANNVSILGLHNP